MACNLNGGLFNLVEMSVVKGKVFRTSCCFIVEAHFGASNNYICVQCDFLDKNDVSSAWHQCQSVHFGIKTSSKELDIQGIC